jgi:hemin uptake protein HemP
MSEENRDPDDVDEPAKPTDAPVIDVADWFGDRREVWLELDGVRYRLRITRRNKLILQK